jgi:hypothetical protein
MRGLLGAEDVFLAVCIVAMGCVLGKKSPSREWGLVPMYSKKVIKQYTSDHSS